MTQQHLITPPLELVQQWMTEARSQDYCSITEQVAFHAAQWGADQKLEACRHWLEVNGAPRKFIDGLLAFRRPKPPSLKEEAMRVLVENGTTLDGRMELELEDIDTIRRALEQLPNQTSDSD